MCVITHGTDKKTLEPSPYLITGLRIRENNGVRTEGRLVSSRRVKSNLFSYQARESSMVPTCLLTRLESLA